MAFKKLCHVGEIIETKSSGKVEIIEDNGIFNEFGQRIVKIKYLDTGYEDNVIYKNLLKGFGTDPTRFMYEVSDKIFNSNNYGDYKVIEELIGPGDQRRDVKVQFLDTGYEYITRKRAALQGKVKDPTRFMYNIKDILFKSNYYGEFKIISEAPYRENDPTHKHKMVNIQFINTGAISTVAFADCEKGNVSDPTFKNPQEAEKIIGISIINNIREYLFIVWKNIMARCNKTNTLNYKYYGDKGVKICEEWKNFDIFLYDAQRLPGWEYKFNHPSAFDIDKDLLQIDIPINQRIYSRNTTIWLDKKTNLDIANGINIIKYYNNIYSINGLYFVKCSDGFFSYGPYFSLEDAILSPVY